MTGFLPRTRVRVLSNYLRLFTTFAVGLLVVRLLAEVGASALNVYLLLLSGTGFAYFFMVVMQESVIPLLGLSYEDKDNRSFARIYWISLLLGVASSLIAVAIFWVIWSFRDSLDTGTIPLTTLGIALASGALRTIATAVTTPPLHAVLLSGGIVFYNIVQAVERVVDLIAVVFVLFVLPQAGEAMQTNVFFLLSAGLYTLIQISVFLYAKRVDPRFAVRPVPVRKTDLTWVGKIFSWNLALVVAFLLYLRLSTFVVNAHYGEGATLVLGLVFLLVGYQRQISMGLVIGLDAVIARIYGSGKGQDLHKGPGGGSAVNAMILRTSYVQGLFSFGSIAVLWLLAEPIFRYWLGGSLDGRGWNPEQAANLFRIMSLGSLARSVSESWMKLLNGRGLVSHFAPWVLLGGLVFAGLLFYWAEIETDVSMVLIWVAVAYSVLVMIVHLGVVPMVLCRAQNIPLLTLVKAALAPGLTTILPLVALVYMAGLSETLISSLGTVALICLISAMLLFSPRAMRIFAPQAVEQPRSEV